MPPGEGAGAPASAYELVAQLRAQLGALRSSIGSTDSEAHTLSQPTARHLGLYPVEKAQERAQAPLSPESWSDAMDVLGASVRAMRESVQAMPASENGPASVHELGAQAIELVGASMGIQQSTALAARPGAVHTLPESLYKGALRGDACADRAAALGLLDGLCAAISPAATELQLECFQERVDEGTERTHTFTSGGRIIVLDIELGLQSGALVPHVELKLSYAHADGHAHSEGASDSRLPRMMQNVLQQLTNVLFGVPVDRAVFRACPAEAAQPTQYTDALRLWQGFVAHLATLAYIDELCASLHTEPKRPVDLFAQLDELGTVAEQLCLAQAAALGVSGLHSDALATLADTHPDTAATLVRCAQGIAWHHVVSPYLTLHYASPVLASRGAYTATVRIAPSAVPSGAANARAPAHTPPELVAAIEKGVQSSGPVLAAAPLWTPSGSEKPVQRPVTYVALLNPPVLVPQRVAQGVCHACGLSGRPWASAPVDRAGETYLARFLGAARGAFRASATDEFAQETRAISSLPFASLAQLYDALALLRDYARFGELLSNAASSSCATPVTVDLEAAPAPGRSVLRLTFAVPTHGAMANLALRTTADQASGYEVEAHVVPLNGGEARTLLCTDPQSVQWADTLARTAQLAALVDTAHAWACAA